MPGYYVKTGYPSLTPTYSLGSSARTGPAILIGSRNSKIGTQARIYAWMKSHGEGPQYIQFLIKVIGTNGNTGRGNTNPLSVIYL